MFKKLILTALIVAWSLSGAVSAATFTWVGARSALWTDPNNWDIGVGLPVNGTTGDVVMINSTTTPNFNPNVSIQGALYSQMYVQNDGMLTISAGDTTNYGLLGSGSSYNSIVDGTIEVLAGGTWNMAQNLYISHTDVVGSYGILNIRAGGVVRTGGVLTIAGRRGGGEMNIWGTYMLVSGARWDYLPVQSMLPYAAVIRIYEGGLFRWTGDHVGNTTDNQNNMPWLISTGRLVSGVVGYEVVTSFDLVNNRTDATIARYARAYSPVYNPALINDAVNVNAANLNTATGTIDLSWTNPQQSGVGDVNAVQSTVYLNTYIGTAVPAPTTVIAGPAVINSVTGVPISKLNNYAWRVDSYDPNTKITTPGDVWTFNTQNLAPIASAETSPQRIWVISGAANITLHATATDDGYPLPTPTLTYTWTQTDTTKDILAAPSVSQDVPLYFGTAFTATVTTTAPQTRNFSVVCSDGDKTGPAYAVAVTVYANACLAGQAAGSVTLGDVHPLATTTTPIVVGDCMVNFKDFARLAGDWMKCKIYDGICPL